MRPTVGRSYGCTISEGGAAPEPARVRIDSGQLLIEGSRSRRIDLIDVEAIAREDVLIGVRVCPGEMIVFQKLGRDFEIFYDEIGSERRRRVLSGLFLLDRSPSKCFPCRFSMDASDLEADLELYPTSVLFYPNGATPFHIPLSYIARQAFDPDRWTVELELCSGTRFLSTGSLFTGLDLQLSTADATSRLVSLWCGFAKT